MRFRSKLFFRLSAKRSDLLFTVSDYSRQALASRYRVPIQKIVITANGVDTRRFTAGAEGRAAVQALGIPPGEYLITVGRLEPRKNHIGLLKAFSLLPQPRPKLVIVGQEDFGFEKIYQTVEDLGLAHDIVFIKSADAALLASLYRHARVFVYPTFAEGFGIPVLEAMASGVPVITSNTTSLPEVTGQAALLIDPASPDSIRQALNAVLRDSALRARMIEKGQQQATRFSWDKSAHAMERSYRTYFGLVPWS
jgi:glycosyltransferase involved in cell wall biosynthesis